MAFRARCFILFSGIFVIAALISVRAKAADMSLARQGTEATLSANVQSDFAGTEATVMATDPNTIEIRIPGADFSVDGKKQLFRYEDPIIKAASVLRDGTTGVVRFTLKEKTSGFVADRLTLQRAAGTNEKGETTSLVITVPEADTQGPALSTAKTVAITAAPKAAADAGGKSAAGDEATGLTVGAAAATADDKAASAPPQDKRPESQIPVFVSKKDTPKEAGSGVERLVMTLGVICVLLAATLFGLKRWAATRSKQKPNTKIQILTQHHLGPKKSLAIIQVAGEAILIGITDQNISMLKTLALIDDEVPGHVPRNFADEMETDITRQDVDDDADERADENFAVSGLRDVRDIVSNRLKGMKDLR